MARTANAGPQQDNGLADTSLGTEPATRGQCPALRLLRWFIWIYFWLLIRRRFGESGSCTFARQIRS